MTLDGRVVLSDANESQYYVPATPYDPILVYDQPTSYGSVAVVGVQTVGAIFKPLKKGKHIIKLYEPYVIPTINFGVIYDNTWEITVIDEREAENCGHHHGHRR